MKLVPRHNICVHSCSTFVLCTSCCRSSVARVVPHPCCPKFKPHPNWISEFQIESSSSLDCFQGHGCVRLDAHCHYGIRRISFSFFILIRLSYLGFHPDQPSIFFTHMPQRGFHSNQILLTFLLSTNHLWVTS